MTDDKKKEYLKKNFVQPLSESLPLSCDYFVNSNIDQCISVNENFASYINFDLKSITQDFIIKKHTQSQSQLSSNLEANYAFNFSQGEFELVDLKPNRVIRNSILKVDAKIEFDIQKYSEEVDDVNSKEINFRDGHSIYKKNFKKILLHHHLQRFKLNIQNRISDVTFFYENLLIPNFSDLVTDDYFEGFYYDKNDKEKYRNESEFTPSKNSKMSKVMSELQTSTSIKNVFEDPFFVEASQQNKNSQIEQNSQINKEEKVFDNLYTENSLSLNNCKYESSSYLGKEQFQMINKELQENIKKYFLFIKYS